MELSRFLVVIIVLTGSSAFSAMSPYEKMHCLFNSISDDPDSCLLGITETLCKTTKCLKTIGQHCTLKPSEYKLNGNECGKGLLCDCDHKCSGCMTVNGERKCYYPENCIGLMGKRSQLPEILDYPNGHDRMDAIYS